MLLIDINEPAELIDALGRYINVKIVRLDAGDYRFGSTVVERKTIHDLAASLHSGRIYEQAFRMEKYGRSYLVIERFSDVFCGRLAGVSSMILAAMNDLCVEFGIQLLLSSCMTETARIIRKLYFKRDLLPRIQRCRNDEFALRVLTGISKSKLRALFRKYSTIRSVASADMKDISSIEGIGKATAGKIIRVLDKRIEI